LNCFAVKLPRSLIRERGPCCLSFSEMFFKNLTLTAIEPQVHIDAYEMNGSAWGEFVQVCIAKFIDHLAQELACLTANIGEVCT